MQDFNNYISAEDLNYNAKGGLGEKIPFDVSEQFFAEKEVKFKQALVEFFTNNQNLEALAEDSKGLLESHKDRLISAIEEALTNQNPAEYKREEASKARGNIIKGERQLSHRTDLAEGMYTYNNSGLINKPFPKEFLEGVLRYYIELSQRANSNMLRLMHNQQFIENQKSIENQ